MVRMVSRPCVSLQLAWHQLLIQQLCLAQPGFAPHIGSVNYSGLHV